MESFYKQNRRLIESGKTQQEIESSLIWNPATMELTDTGQSFDDIETRRQNFETWHYAAGLDQYFKTVRGYHGFMTAFSTLFDPTRWEEIEHLLDEMDVHRLLSLGNLARLRKKVLRARDNGLLTAGEIQLMSNVVNGQ